MCITHNITAVFFAVVNVVFRWIQTRSAEWKVGTFFYLKNINSGESGIECKELK